MTSGPFAPEGSLVVHNPVSGRASGRRRAARVVAELARRGYDVAPTNRPGEAAAIVARASRGGLSSVVAVGGDGTLFEAIEKLPPGVAVAIYPTGTVNLLARALSIPVDETHWLDLLSSGSAESVYFARCNGRPFASVASVGFDARVVARVNRTLKKWIQEGAYAVRALMDLPAYRAPALGVRIDGEPAAGPLAGVLIGKGPYFAGRHRVLASADPRAPTLEVAVLAGHGRRPLLRYARGVLFGSLARQRGVSIRTAREVFVESDPASHVELDGEPFGRTPTRFDVEPEPRLVLAPTTGNV